MDFDAQVKLIETMMDRNGIPKIDPGNQSFSIAVVAGRNTVDPKITDEDKRNKIEAKMVAKWERNCYTYKELFFPPWQYKLLADLVGKPVIQHGLENIVAAVQSPLARALGVDGLIDRVVVAGEKSSLDKNVVYPDSIPIDVVEGGSSLLGTGLRCVFALSPDNMLFPDINRGFEYIKDRDMIRDGMTWKTKSIFEMFGVLANAIHENGIANGDYTISVDQAKKLILEKKEEMIKRIHFPKRLQMSDSKLFEKIFGNKHLSMDYGSRILFEDNVLDYFVDFHQRNERKVIFLGGDCPFNNPGVAFTIYQYLTDFSDHEFMLNLVPEDALAPYINLFGYARPYLPVEFRLRTINGHVIMPNKVGRIESGNRLYNSIRFNNPMNAIGAILMSGYDPGEKRINLSGFRMAGKAAYNQFMVLRHLQRRNPSSSGYMNLVKRYWDLRSDEKISDWDNVCSSTIRARFGFNLSPYGGMSYDVDSIKPDQELFNKHFDELQDMQAGVVNFLFSRGIYNRETYHSHLKEKEERIKSLMLSGEMPASEMYAYFKNMPAKLHGI